MTCMAEIVSDSVWAETVRKSVSKYPWDEWFDGKTRILVQGEDFTVTPASIRNTITVNAFRRRVAIRTRVLDGNRVLVQALQPQDAGSTP
jgi:hypothetical protein